jgi:hypothetical protein
MSSLQHGFEQKGHDYIVIKMPTFNTERYQISIHFHEFINFFVCFSIIRATVERSHNVEMEWRQVELY